MKVELDVLCREAGKLLSVAARKNVQDSGHTDELTCPCALQHPKTSGRILIVVASAAARKEELMAALEYGAWAKDCETASGPLVRQV